MQWLKNGGMEQSWYPQIGDAKIEKGCLDVYCKLKYLKRTMVEVLKADGHNTLANMLEMSKLVYEPQWEFSGIISYQRKLFVSIRVPLNFRKYATEHIGLLSKTCTAIYIDDDEYACYGIKEIGVLPIQAEEVHFQNKSILLEKVQYIRILLNFFLKINVLMICRRTISLKHVRQEIQAICFPLVLCWVALQKYY